MKSKSTIKGKITYELRDADGNLKQSGTTENSITTEGNNYYC